MLGERYRPKRRKEAPQKGWSKGDSGDHFADDTRLAEALEGPTDRAGASRITPIESSNCSAFTRVPCFPKHVLTY
jgi:hypothetical protein